jgi:3-methylcrotonyl-CoA carboxylase beta subunit
MWPNARISVMGGDQAADVLVTIKKDQMKAKGKNFPDSAAGKLKEEILSKYSYEGSPYYSTSRLWDDGIIDPAETRRILAMGISMSLNRAFGDPKYGVFRM